MKIKLPFTEKFLWDLYKFTAVSPKAYNFRDEWFKKNKAKRDRKRFAELVCKLKNKGYIRTLKIKDGMAIALTSVGAEKLFKINLKMTDKKLRNDGAWQMVLFDIPESRRRDRDSFRDGLQYLGYKKLQNSIWVCQYDVMRETEELIKRRNLDLFVELLLVNKIGWG